MYFVSCGLCNLQIVLVNRKFIAGGNGELRISSDYTCRTYKYTYVCVLLSTKNELTHLTWSKAYFTYTATVTNILFCYIFNKRMVVKCGIIHSYNTHVKDILVFKVTAGLVSWQLGRTENKIRIFRETTFLRRLSKNSSIFLT